MTQFMMRLAVTGMWAGLVLASSGAHASRRPVKGGLDRGVPSARVLRTTSFYEFRRHGNMGGSTHVGTLQLIRANGTTRRIVRYLGKTGEQVPLRVDARAAHATVTAARANPIAAPLTLPLNGFLSPAKGLRVVPDRDVYAMGNTIPIFDSLVQTEAGFRFKDTVVPGDAISVVVQHANGRYSALTVHVTAPAEVPSLSLARDAGSPPK